MKIYLMLLCILTIFNLAFANTQTNILESSGKRCLDDLSKSTVDAAIGSYHAGREKFGVYPKVVDKVDPSKAISKYAVCFTKNKNSSFFWDGRNIQGNNKMVIAVTTGYMIIKALEKRPVIIHETRSADQALILLKKKRVDAALSLCQIDKYAMKRHNELGSQFTLM